MDIKPIRTDEDYQAALQEAGRLMEFQAGTPDGDRLDVLATLIDAELLIGDQQKERLTRPLAR